MTAAVRVSDALGERYRSNRDQAGKLHDMKVTGAMHPLSSEAIKACIPAGQVRCLCVCLGGGRGGWSGGQGEAFGSSGGP